ncbi:hypothetical protein NA57DRAFT_74462 [Rhizodiscina lignyota]|uniref:Uncharacterized protein n=1 Tax=Rhizodiscina lignyota TaxID=1504668 RepID=A0A9P4IJ01_9PEZI|nr:hypothetical protein NA57DRAFT_74462 [Rhizodiscina lignyota]
MSLPTAQPSPDEPPRSRLSAMQSNVRAFLRNPVASSVYSRSPIASAGPTPMVPQMPQLAFLRRQSTPTDEEHEAVLHPTISAETRRSSMSSQSRSPVNNGRIDYSPVNRISLWHEQEQPVTVALGVPDRHDSPRLPRHYGDEEEETVMGRHPADVPLDPETEELANMMRRKRRKRTRCRRCKRGAWYKKKHGRESLWRGSKTRGKCFCALISGIFLVILLAIYLSLALTQSNLGSELHVLFILAIIATTIFFAHSLIRLFMIAMRGPDANRPRHHNRIPSMVGPEGFQPDEPIRVHVVGDDDIVEIEARDEEEDAGHVEGDRDAEDGKMKVPPPAYGLWRSSVRIQPNLLHWARVNNNVPSVPSVPSSSSSSMAPSVRNSPEMSQRENTREGPRPPSYASDDGVDYVVSAQPRSTVFMPNMRPPSQLHPALRDM